MSTKTRGPDPKTEALRRQRLSKSSSREPSPILSFKRSDFFDARDLVQVKYEMLRRVRVEARPITESAAAFGFSRPSFYQAQSAFDLGGLSGLLAEEARAPCARTS